jgi:hypothetical protein
MANMGCELYTIAGTKPYERDTGCSGELRSVSGLAGRAMSALRGNLFISGAAW